MPVFNRNPAPQTAGEHRIVKRFLIADRRGAMYWMRDDNALRTLPQLDCFSAVRFDLE
jgi:hypothetical protein